MSYPQPKTPSINDIMVRVAATAWLNHLECKVRQCRRCNRCLGILNIYGMPHCTSRVKQADLQAMVDFLGDTYELETPDKVATFLAQAKTAEEREMIIFRRSAYVCFHEELVKAGLVKAGIVL